MCPKMKSCPAFDPKDAKDAGNKNTSSKCPYADVKVKKEDEGEDDTVSVFVEEKEK